MENSKEKISLGTEARQQSQKINRSKFGAGLCIHGPNDFSICRVFGLEMSDIWIFIKENVCSISVIVFTWGTIQKCKEEVCGYPVVLASFFISDLHIVNAGEKLVWSGKIRVRAKDKKDPWRSRSHGLLTLSISFCWYEANRSPHLLLFLRLPTPPHVRGWSTGKQLLQCQPT